MDRLVLATSSAHRLPGEHPPWVDAHQRPTRRAGILSRSLWLARQDDEPPMNRHVEDMATFRARGAVYYRGRAAHVTSRGIYTAHGEFALRDLEFVTRVAHLRYPARSLALASAAIEILLGLVLAWLFGTFILLGAAFVAAGGLALAAIVDGHRNPYWMELHAIHRGQQTLLFSSRDRREFDQVRRAVLRAMQARRD